MSKLEKATHICLITVSLVSLVVILEKRFANVIYAKPSPTELVGKHLEVAGPVWASSKVHAVLYLGVHCQYCAASMPFYRQLSELRTDGKSATMLWAVSKDPPGEIKDLLAKEQVYVSGIYRTQKDLAIRGTPTLLIVDSSGIVRRVFEGQLDLTREHEVLAIVTAAPS
jgi:hypothetical protein